MKVAAIQMNLASARANSSASTESFLSFMRRIGKQDGYMSLYSGLQAGVTKQVFYATSRLGLYEVIRDGISKHRDTDIFTRLISGVISGGMAAVIRLSPAVKQT